MRKILATILSISFLASPANVLAWGTATHIYLAKELGNKWGTDNLQEMYGSALADMPNLMLGSPYKNILFNQTHYDFAKLVTAADAPTEKALAYGFASHNEKTGADLTAHISAVLAQDDGYVTAKAKLMEKTFGGAINAFFEANNIPHTDQLINDLALTFAHLEVEAAIDLFISQNEDRQVGDEMYLAAEFRDENTPALLAKAFANDLAKRANITYAKAAKIINEAEKQFRQYSLIYGSALAMADNVDIVSQKISQIASAVLAAAYDIKITVPPEMIKIGLLGAMDLVKNDYAQELSATLVSVNAALMNHGVTEP